MSVKLKWFGIVSVIAVGFVIVWFYNNRSSEDVYLYLNCQNINHERLEIQLLDEVGQKMAKRDILLNKACALPYSIVVKDIPTKQLAVTIHLYSAGGKLLVTKQGFREQDNILLDQKGFHIDLNVNGNPAGIDWHTL